MGRLCVESAVINRLPHFLASTAQSHFSEAEIFAQQRRRFLHSRHFSEVDEILIAIEAAGHSHMSGHGCSAFFGTPSSLYRDRRFMRSKRSLQVFKSSRLLCSEELQLSVDVISTSKAAVAWSCSLQLAYAMTSKLTLVMGGGEGSHFFKFSNFV